MTHTRRQFLQTALTGAALIAAGGESFGLGSAANKAMLAGENKAVKNGEWKTVSVSDGSKMKLFVARPDKKKAPAVMVLQEIFGVNDYIRDVTQRIAGLGYVAVAPDLFHRMAPGFESDYKDNTRGMEQMKQMTDAGLEADLKATYEWLTQNEHVNKEKIGSVGYCMGGRASFIANAVLPLQAAASYYGGGIAQILERAKDQHAPLLMFWGGKDAHIGRDKQNATADALKKAGKPYIDVEFSEAGHGFFCDRRDSYHPEAARESWALFSAFFKEHLGE